MAERRELLEQREQLQNVAQVFGITSTEVEPAYVHLRGNPESRGPAVRPGVLEAYSFGNTAALADSASDGERRVALANWISAPDNGLFARVIANRLWHHHFGQGLVSTPSDFGFYGGRPSHPELLESLADDLQRGQWSLKRLHRQLLLTATYRQSSPADRRSPATRRRQPDALAFHPRRLQAESIRDSVLSVAGTLRQRMGGPGFRDFELEERYAPIYRYSETDEPDYWRRSIYRFAVRSVPSPFMEVLDCPNPSTTTPKRSQTTTALQALAMFNDPFVLSQSDHFAHRLERDIERRSSRCRFDGI